MRTLHASKDLREKFCEAARNITTNSIPDFDLPPNVPHIVSESGLREVLTKRLKTDFIADETVKYSGKSVEQSTHARYRVETGKEIEQMLIEELASLVGCVPNRIKKQGAYWHPPGSYTQWNVKPNFPGWRVYFTYADRPNESFIRWMEEGDVRTSNDTGFDLRMFYAGGKSSEFWSAIYAGKSHRLTVGFNVLS